MNHTRETQVSTMGWSCCHLFKKLILFLSENPWSNPSSTGTDGCTTPRIAADCQDGIGRIKGLKDSKSQLSVFFGGKAKCTYDFCRQSICQLQDHNREFWVQVINQTHRTLLVYLTLTWLRRKHNRKHSRSIQRPQILDATSAVPPQSPKGMHFDHKGGKEPVRIWVP